MQNPEEDLFLKILSSACRPGPTEGLWRRIPADRPVDWSTILRWGKEAGVHPLLYRVLCRHDLRNKLSEEARTVLREAYVANGVRNLTITAQVREVLQALNGEGIIPITLKGSALMEQVYENLALRTMADIDLLVPRGDLPRVDRVMRRMGYANGPEAVQDWYWKHHYHAAPYVGPRGLVPVEVHHDLFYPQYRRMAAPEEFFSRSWPVETSGVRSRVMSTEDLLLHVMLHAAIYGKTRIRIRQLCDVLWITEKKPIDWDQVILRASQWKMTRTAYTVLYLAKHLLGANISSGTLRAFYVRSRVLHGWFSGPCIDDLLPHRVAGAKPRGPRYFRKTAAYLQEAWWRETWADRLLVLSRKIQRSVSWRIMNRRFERQYGRMNNHPVAMRRILGRSSP